MRRLALAVLLLAGCSKEPSSKPAPRGGGGEADPGVKDARFTLVEVDAARTRAHGGGPLLVVMRDGELGMRAPLLDEHELARAAFTGDAVDLPEVAARYVELRTEIDAAIRAAPPPEMDLPDVDHGDAGDPSEGMIRFSGTRLDPELAHQQALEAARAAGILDDPCSDARMDAAEDPPRPPRPGLHAGVSRPASCTGLPLLIVADSGADAAIVLGAMRAVRVSQLAVTTDGGAHARPLMLAIVSGPGEVEAASLELVFTLRADGVEATAAGGATPWTWKGEARQLGDAYREGRAVGGMADARVRVHVDGRLTAGALITALAELVEADLTALVIS